jgi:hypothetical protein
VYAVGSRAGNVGMLWIQAGAASPITSMTAHLIDKKTGADKLNVTDLSLRQGTATYGVWRVAKPITVGQLRPGTYQVQLDVTDSAGTSVTGISAGQFDFINTPLITFRTDRTTVDYDHPSATVQGHVQVATPAGTRRSYADQPVTLSGTATYLLDSAPGACARFLARRAPGVARSVLVGAVGPRR